MAQAFTLIQSQNSNSSTPSSFVFNSIPQGYTDLYLEGTLQGTSGSPQTVLQVAFSSGSGYITQKLGASPNSTPSAGGNSGLGSLYQGNINASTGSSFAFCNWYIPVYSSTVANKGYYSTASGIWNSTPIYMNWVSGYSSQTAAISSITITNEYGNWAQYCTLNLYGILQA
jgi:hypothetical protein